MTKSARRSSARSPALAPAVCRGLYGSIRINAGSSVIEYAHAARMPTAVMLPRCQNGGESEKFSARKPTIVVSDVIVTGMKFRRSASTSALSLSTPSRMTVRIDIRMWIESAIASVRMMIGAEPEIGVRLMPAKPAQPMPTIIENRMTASVASVAVSERRISNVSSRMTPNMIGTSVPRSDWPVSAKALFNADTPVSDTSMPG